MANSQSSAAWAGGPTANPEASTVAAQVLRKSAIPVRRVALRASRAGRPAPIMSRLHDAEPELEGIEGRDQSLQLRLVPIERSEEHTSELQSLMRISYAVFCLKKNKPQQKTTVKPYHTNKPQI